MPASVITEKFTGLRDGPGLRSRFLEWDVSVLELVLLLVFAWSAWRNKWLADDGYIYLTYIQNMTENGRGPVLNSGEFVEGYTSPAWFCVLSVLNWIRPSQLLDLRQLVLLFSLILSIGAMVGWIRIETVARRLSGGPASHEKSQTRFVRNQTRLNIPLVFAAAWYPLHSFATSGLETPLQLVALMVVIYYVWSGANCAWAVGLIAGFLPLVRPELGILSLLLLGRHWWGNRDIRSILTSLTTFAAPLLVLFAARVMTYGQLLPNTYYAKTNTKFGRQTGLLYLRDTLMAYGLHWVIAAAVLAVAIPLLGSSKKNFMPANSRRAWFLGASIAMTAYVVAVAGDFMHARFLLTSVLLLIAVFAGLGTKAVEELGNSAGKWHRLTVAGVVTAVLFLAVTYTAPVQRVMTKVTDKNAAQFADISDEEFAYFKQNDALHHWSPDKLHPWAAEGVALRNLSERLGTEIGYTARAIGNLSYSGQMGGGNLYVYDVLGLTRPDVARLDMRNDRETRLRVGHAKVAPDVLVAANPRVDFVFKAPYFEDWSKDATVKFEDHQFVLLNFDLLDLLVERSVIPADQAQRLRDWALSKLEGPRVDRNFVTFLTLTYHRDDRVSARVRELANLDRSSAWRTWLNDTESERNLLEPRGCADLGLGACISRALARQSAPPIDTIPNKPDWASINKP